MMLGVDRKLQDHKEPWRGEWLAGTFPCLSSTSMQLPLPEPLLCARHLVGALLYYAFNFIPGNNVVCSLCIKLCT